MGSCIRSMAVVSRKLTLTSWRGDGPPRFGELNRSRGRGYGLTLEVRERPVTRLYVGE
jgi:hypothetical protein